LLCCPLLCCPLLCCPLLCCAQIFDDKGPAALVELVRQDVEDIFPARPPEHCSDEEAAAFASLEKQLLLAKEVVEYLEDMLPEVQKVPSGGQKRPARLDVLAAAMTEINAFLTLRLTRQLDPAAMATEGLLLGDLHGMIAWLTDYKLALSDIYCPPPAPGAPSPAAFPLFAAIPELCQWYVEGIPGSSCEGAAKHIKGHVLKVGGEDRVMQDSHSSPLPPLHMHILERTLR
jgi:hypothetical protein